MKTTVSEKGQVTIPKRLRERLGIRPGQVLDLEEEQGRLVATKVTPQDPVESVYGILKRGRSTDDHFFTRQSGRGVITAVDTSVLLDVFGADPAFGSRSRGLIRSCLREGGLVACEVVWAEVASFFPSPDAAGEAMTHLAVEYSPIELKTALAASRAWKVYRSRGGHRDRVVADFLIGAHAYSQAERLLTRDRGFYRTYFTRLRVLDPAKV